MEPHGKSADADGMSLGSTLAGIMYASHGWQGVCLIGAALPATLLAFWLITMIRDLSNGPDSIQTQHV